MSNRNNVVLNVLPTASDTAILAADLTPSDLTVGKIGFFNADTGVSFIAADPIPERYFIAVGTPDGNFRMSSGQTIQSKGVIGFQRKNYEAGASMSVTISGYKTKFDAEYGFRVEFRNSHIYRIQGYNQFSKAYIIKTPCQADCSADTTCIDPNEITKLLLAEVLKDEGKLMNAVAVVDQDVTAADVAGIDADLTAGDEVSAAQIDFLIAENVANDNTAITTSIVLTPNTVSGGNFNAGINLSYHKLLETVLLVSPLHNLNCTGTTITSTTPTFAQGTGNNILQKEYHASSWNGAGPYAISKTTNTAIGNIEFLADKNTNYTQFALEYDVVAEGGWLSYKNPLTTIVAVPATHSTAIASVNTMMEALVA